MEGGAMRVKLLVTVSAIALVSAACTGSVGSPRGAVGDATIPNETLLLGTEAGPLVVSVPEGAVRFEREGSVASLGGGWVLSAWGGEGSTSLLTRDDATGETFSTDGLPGGLDARVVSESGRAVALTEPLPAGWDPQVPLPRSSTTIVVADPTGERDPMTFDLPGNYEPEAFSSDDERLFLIQHLPAETPRVYRVTVLDVDRGRVRPVFGPFKGEPERMPGIRLQQAISPVGDQLYTLYSSARPGYVPHGATASDEAVVSFVHVLSLDEHWAHCVGLPESMWDRPASAQAMASSSDGERLYVVDAGRGTIAMMDTFSLETTEYDVDLDAPAAIERTTASMSTDGQTLFVAAAGRSTSIVSAIDLYSFEVASAWRLDGSVSGLGLSADGARLYAAVGGGLSVLDARTGESIGETVIDAPDEVQSILPIGA
jgi:hypothetical protein